ncbi:MAG: metallophosphoesterase [Gemmatimonadetes bacterium]|nr:metallophosphoesterase [Gemmatimonadota bacterium]
MIRLLHASDLHFGKPSVPAQIEALEAFARAGAWDAIVVSGDLSQRTRTREFLRARAFLDRMRALAPLLVIPGNHDVAWWMAPMGLGSTEAMYTRYSRYISEELEPVLQCPGLTIAGVNSSHGIRPFTLTTRPRDLSVVGAVRPSQWARARERFAAAGDDCKVLVLHHNLLRGHLSNRWGLSARARGIDEAAATGADLVLCGHDHEEQVAQVEAGGRRFVVSTASTLTTRVRGHRPASFNVIEVEADAVRMTVMAWSGARRDFEAGATSRFPR